MMKKKKDDAVDDISLESFIFHALIESPVLLAIVGFTILLVILFILVIVSPSPYGIGGMGIWLIAKCAVLT